MMKIDDKTLKALMLLKHESNFKIVLEWFSAEALRMLKAGAIKDDNKQLGAALNLYDFVDLVENAEEAFKQRGEMSKAKGGF